MAENVFREVKRHTRPIHGTLALLFVKEMLTVNSLGGTRWASYA